MVMAKVKTPTVYRKDYQAPSFFINQVSLEFSLGEEYTDVRALSRVRKNPNNANPTLQLTGQDCQLIKISINGKELDKNDYLVNDNELILDKLDMEFDLEIHTRIQPQLNKQLSGLYKSNGMFCTQCEAEGFRRITYFLDRPDNLCQYRVKIIADKTKYPVLLSNGNCVEKGDLNDGQHYAVWFDPFLKPSYLFALVAGDLECIEDAFVTASGRHVDIHFYVESGNQDKCQYAIEALKRAMRWDEVRYGREYDLDIYMVVAVGDFNMGAMENKGLNIFNTKYVLAKPETATDEDFLGVERVIAHEYFHNWTGNRVTCRDWFQLSLKEGLTVFREQQFCADMHSPAVNRIEDVKLLKTLQFPEDAGSMAHPVRPESYIEINNFYTMTVYEKGAEVIRMQHCLLGEEGFRKGMDLYFERFDGKAVTIDDFVQAMEDANGKDLSQFMHWYSQAGTPHVRVSMDYDTHEQSLSLNFSQSNPRATSASSECVYLIPLAMKILSHDGEVLQGERVLELNQKEQSVRFEGIAKRPVVSLLRGFSAPIFLEFEQDEDDLAAIVQYENDGYARWQAFSKWVVKTLSQMMQKPSKEALVPEPLLQTYKAILNDDAMDDALKAKLLAMPSFEDIASCLSPIDVDAICDALDAYQKALGQTLYHYWSEQYRTLQQSTGNRVDGDAFKARKLKAVCLEYLMASQEAEAINWCVEQFNTCALMSDEITALGLLAHQQGPARDEALQAFCNKWQDDELVMDKWFAVQAKAQRPSVLAEVQTLINTSHFDDKNPNKIRALIGSFSMANPRYFHCLSGNAYEFLKQQVLRVDAFNSQVAARLLTPFTRIKRYDLARQALMEKVLKDLANHKLSKDCFEIVSKSLT